MLKDEIEKKYPIKKNIKKLSQSSCTADQINFLNAKKYSNVIACFHPVFLNCFH